MELVGGQPGGAKGRREVLRDLYYTLAVVASETNDAAGCMSNAALVLQMEEAEVKERGKPDARFAAANNQMGVACAMAAQLSQATEHFKRSVSLYEGLADFHVDMLAWPTLGWSTGCRVSSPTPTRPLLLPLRIDIRRLRDGQGFHKVSPARANQYLTHVLGTTNLLMLGQDRAHTVWLRKREGVPSRGSENQRRHFNLLEIHVGE